MKYIKLALTYTEQADLLLGRGLSADREALIARLRSVNYYRLSGYLYPFRNPDDTFRAGTTLDAVWQHYTFDRRLRLIVLDGIERVEVAIRTQLVYEHVHRHGPFGYVVPANLPKLNGQRFDEFMARVYSETQRSHEIFVKHFQEKYGDQHGYLPLWMAVEIVPLGLVFTLFTGVEPAIKRSIARQYDIPDKVLFSWLGVLNGVRNICAHHGRLWNRELGFKPLLPNRHKHPTWHTPVTIPNNRVFAILTILKYMLGFVAPQSQWPQRLQHLLDEYPDIPRKNMGFPVNWEECPIWQRS
ncbi:MAG TPA: Abi family protein [Candidatus Hydrogenedentes bacterium]|nr:Abi family protein [Candidatus Hydrogenedentota bacterium]HOS03688.1 Abi family protein [Candidatus Hydrogenedentota bacterium]